MSRLFICGNGEITIDIDTLPVLASAWDDERADALVRCAVLLALSSLVQGGSWPTEAIATMIAFMERMRQEVALAELM